MINWNKKQTQQSQAPTLRLPKLSGICLHRKKFLSSHPTCEGSAQMCSQKCSRVGHLKQEHKIIQIQQLQVNIKAQRDRKIELTEKLVSNIQAAYKQIQKFVYQVYMMAKSQIEKLCYNQQELKLMGFIQAGKTHAVACSHIYYLDNIETNKREIERKGQQIIIKFKNLFKQDKKQKNANGDLDKILIEIKRQFEGRLQQQKKKYMQRSSQLEDKNKKLFMQLQNIKVKYQKQANKGGIQASYEFVNNKNSTNMKDENGNVKNITQFNLRQGNKLFSFKELSVDKNSNISIGKMGNQKSTQTKSLGNQHNLIYLEGQHKNTENYKKQASLTIQGLNKKIGLGPSNLSHNLPVVQNQAGSLSNNNDINKKHQKQEPKKKKVEVCEEFKASIKQKLEEKQKRKKQQEQKKQQKNLTKFANQYTKEEMYKKSQKKSNTVDQQVVSKQVQKTQKQKQQQRYLCEFPINPVSTIKTNNDLNCQAQRSLNGIGSNNFLNSSNFVNHMPLNDCFKESSDKKIKQEEMRHEINNSGNNYKSFSQVYSQIKQHQKQINQKPFSILGNKNFTPNSSGIGLEIPAKNQGNSALNNGNSNIQLTNRTQMKISMPPETAVIRNKKSQPIQFGLYDPEQHNSGFNLNQQEIGYVPAVVRPDQTVKTQFFMKQFNKNTRQNKNDNNPNQNK